MSRVPEAAAFFLVLSTLVPAAAARGDTPGRTRVTIRGTGSAVVIERSEAPVSRRLSETTSSPAGPLDEAVRLKAQGANDTAVIAYLRAHAPELPPVVGSEDVRQLRKAGAGKSVVAYLTTVAAVDIGETGEGQEIAASAAPVSPNEMESTPYAVSDGYAVSGGYGAPYRARPVHRGFPRAHRMTSPPRARSFQRHTPSRSGSPRHTMRYPGRY